MKSSTLQIVTFGFDIDYQKLLGQYTESALTSARFQVTRMETKPLLTILAVERNNKKKPCNSIAQAQFNTYNHETTQNIGWKLNFRSLLTHYYEVQKVVQIKVLLICEFKNDLRIFLTWRSIINTIQYILNHSMLKRAILCSIYLSTSI